MTAKNPQTEMEKHLSKADEMIVEVKENDFYFFEGSLAEFHKHNPTRFSLKWAIFKLEEDGEFSYDEFDPNIGPMTTTIELKS